MSLYYEKDTGAPDAETISPSVRIRFPRSMLVRIDRLASEAGTPFLDRSETIRALIADSPRYREAGNAA
jgi:hypothetical protein